MGASSGVTGGTGGTDSSLRPNKGHVKSASVSSSGPDSGGGGAADPLRPRYEENSSETCTVLICPVITWNNFGWIKIFNNEKLFQIYTCIIARKFLDTPCIFAVVVVFVVVVASSTPIIIFSILSFGFGAKTRKKREPTIIKRNLFSFSFYSRTSASPAATRTPSAFPRNTSSRSTFHSGQTRPRATYAQGSPGDSPHAARPSFFSKLSSKFSKR